MRRPALARTRREPVTPEPSRSYLYGMRFLPLLLLIAAAGCAGARHEPTAMPGTVPSNPADWAIVAVQASAVGEGFGFFPSHPARARCVIHGGGPSPGLRIVGICATRVAPRRGYSGQTLVVFTEDWPWRAFHYGGSPHRRQHHSWRFLVLPSGKVARSGQSGDFPPQSAR